MGFPDIHVCESDTSRIAITYYNAKVYILSHAI